MKFLLRKYKTSPSPSKGGGLLRINMIKNWLPSFGWVGLDEYVSNNKTQTQRSSQLFYPPLPLPRGDYSPTVSGSIKLILFILFSLFFISGIQAKSIPEKSNHLMNDYAHLLSADEVQALEQKLDDISNNSSNQICVVIEESLEDEYLEDYCNKLFIKFVPEL